MKKPTSQIAEVLYLLINGTETSLSLVNNGILNPTARITALRNKGVDILCERIKVKNRFGRQVNFGTFKVANKKKAIEYYNQIN